MLKNILKASINILVCMALAYTPLPRAEQLSLPSGDIIAPEITQERFESTVAPGSDHEIKVKVTDDVSVKRVTVYYRAVGEKEYKRRSMQKIGETDDYVTKVYADEIKAPGIEYYIEAEDLAGNKLLHGAGFSPLMVKMEPGAAEPDVAQAAEEDAAAVAEPEKEKKGVSKWVWIGLGALAIGAIAAAGGSSGGDGGTDPSTATLNISAPEPTN